FRMEAGAISLKEGSRPFALDASLLGSDKSLGQLAVQGPQWAPLPSSPRLTDADGSLVAGFERVNTSYPSKWSEDPPPGLNANTSVDHAAVVTSFTTRQESLD